MKRLITSGVTLLCIVGFVVSCTNKQETMKTTPAASTDAQKKETTKKHSSHVHKKATPEPGNDAETSPSPSASPTP